MINITLKLNYIFMKRCSLKIYSDLNEFCAPFRSFSKLRLYLTLPRAKQVLDYDAGKCHERSSVKLLIKSVIPCSNGCDSA